ncbi:hypothetical protein LSH36_16g14087 [Paralvinella palmiformis]|uniref:Uncharacterized protein n=1 Tax=Paralvinella palmiformis TaxID=53620 RepID=A0AAD9NIN1_9ANNE|nr:hypothetical protein LSH36_16g14087 [Paralvinella palmiformis]
MTSASVHTTRALNHYIPITIYTGKTCEPSLSSLSCHLLDVMNYPVLSDKPLSHSRSVCICNKYNGPLFGQSNKI